MALLALSLFCSGAVRAADSSCLECHPVHYEAQGSCTDCHGGRPDTRRKEIAHDRMLAARFVAFTLPDSPVVEFGVKLLDKTACRRCHLSANKGNNFAANLDWSPYRATADELFMAIKKPALFMPDFHFTDRQIVALVNAVYAASSKASRPEKEVPVRIHFANQQDPEQFVFEKNCGSCHRMLTQEMGGLGEGVIGPNLSGLLSEFYPQSYPEKKSWTLKGLEDWLKNPRKLKKNATMSPLPPTEEEWQKLQREIRGTLQPDPAAE